MKHFTPELYVRINSRNRKVVDAAHEEWEASIDDYKQHLRDISSRLTPSTRQLAESLCLHDASYLGVALPQFPSADNSLAILWTRREETFVVLVYVLAEEPLIQEVKVNWPFSKENVHWLYDEFDVDQNGIQQHEILLSNGRLITLRFHEMQQIQHEIHAPSAVA
ncbi:MAG: hypothetical protein WED34_03715 [Planctomycetales bacterium]